MNRGRLLIVKNEALIARIEVVMLRDDYAVIIA
jgi:hypothetical protein